MACSRRDGAQKGPFKSIFVLTAVHLPLRFFELWVTRRTGEVSAIQASPIEVRSFKMSLL